MVSTGGIWCTILNKYEDTLRIRICMAQNWDTNPPAKLLPKESPHGPAISTPVGTGSQSVPVFVTSMSVPQLITLCCISCPGHKLKLYLRHLIHVNLQRGCCHDTASSSMMSVNVSWIMLELPKPTLTCDLVR